MDAELETELERQCRACHAEVAAASGITVCPSCGGAVAARNGASLDLAGATAREADRRGILLPRRHAAGGVITPR